MSLIAISYPELIQKDFDWIQSLRKKYDNDGFNLLDAHVTFIFPTEKIKQDKLLNHIRPKIQSFPKIDIELIRFKLSNKLFQGKWFIFLVPEKGKKQITELHDILYTDLLAPELSIEYPFDPHMTIGCLKNKNQCLDIIEKLNKKNFCIKGHISSIDVATYKNNLIRTIEKINLS
ncbi:MAG: 2'-5' RNA ligase family protein [candidate division Zixibacteria bacterium]|nr:2'-5' RNA ligase family protein [candidate division Zixibacteria bacterium]